MIVSSFRGHVKYQYRRNYIILSLYYLYQYCGVACWLRALINRICLPRPRYLSPGHPLGPQSLRLGAPKYPRWAFQARSLEELWNKKKSSGDWPTLR
jgi:hypothetical protein